MSIFNNPFVPLAALSDLGSVPSPIRDSVGHINGSISQLGDTTIVHDLMGQTVQSLQPMGDSLLVHDGQGHLVGSVNDFGGNLQVHDTLGIVDQSFQPLGHQLLVHDGVSGQFQGSINQLGDQFQYHEVGGQLSGVMNQHGMQFADFSVPDFDTSSIDFDSFSDAFNYVDFSSFGS